MNGQEPGLFDQPPPDPKRAAWAAFHAQHPGVFAMFERFALEAAAGGVQRIGARAVWERMRWENRVHQRATDEAWALNNNWPPYYARHFLTLHPEHDELPNPVDPTAEPVRPCLFELRNQRASA